MQGVHLHPAVDRRGRRRQQTVTEILDVAAAVMDERGAGGLSLGEVARRMGMRTPSLYGYFDSKNALFDALFAQGWTMLNEAIGGNVSGVGTAPDPRRHFVDGIRVFVRWAVEHPAYAQLMFWRPVPGYAPSPEAYRPAVETIQAVTVVLAALRDRGVVRRGVDIDEAAATLAVLLSGVISQQLANAPGEPFEQGSFTRHLPHLTSMYLDWYGAGEPR